MNKLINIIVVGKRHKGIDHLLYSQCFNSITILILILLLFLLPRTSTIKTNRITTKVLICQCSLWKRPQNHKWWQEFPYQGHEPVRDALTHPIDFWPGSPLLLMLQGKQSAAGWADSRWLQSAARRCWIADAWPLQVLIPFPAPASPSNPAKQLSRFPSRLLFIYFFRLCHSL